MPAAVVLLLAARAVASLSASDVAALQAARNAGLAALEEGNPAEAGKRFEAVRRMAPADPLGWADGAVAAMRLKDFASAEKLLAEALRLSPSDGRLLALDALRRELAGDRAGAIAGYEKAASASPGDAASRWAAARVSIETGDVAGRAAAIPRIQAALAAAPANVFLLVRLGELLRETGDVAGAVAASDRLASLVAGDPRLDAALSDGRRALESGDARTASLKYRVAENILRTTPRYQQARHDVEPGVVGLPLEDWGPALASAVRARAGAPVPVRFGPRPDAALGSLGGIAAVRSAGKEGRDLALAGSSGLRLASAAATGYRLSPSLPDSAAPDVRVADVTNSGVLDLVTPGALWIPEGGATRRVSIAGGERVVPFDVDADGDLDLYVSSKAGDRLLRNNLDGTWTDVTASAGLPAGTRSLLAVAADFDRDGDADLLLTRPEGGFALFDNLRGGRLVPREAGLPSTGRIGSAEAGDVNGDGRLDLVWAADGRGFVALNRGDGTFLPPEPVGPADAVLLFDYDNDGFLDLLLLLASASGPSALYRNDGTGKFSPSDVGALPPTRDAEAVDFDGDGDLDLVLVSPAGTVALYENRGGNANGWLDVALEGLPTGSAKVNRFGFGSEIEGKAQDLYVYRVASRPVTRLGLGSRRRADVLRVVWTNGVPQNALDPPARTLVREVQQLKGSCPFLYAFDGSRWHFVTDVLGRAPAGLLYDGVHQAPADTREWLVVPGAWLGSDGGALTLDFTEELWETAYFDLAALYAVDHPSGSALVTNEKMVPPPFPKKEILTVTHPLTPRASDERGEDRTAEIEAEDGVHLAGFAPTAYQGLVAPHELVLELPEARRGGRVMLYLTGWIFYADTSINVSLSQRHDLAASPPVLEVPDGKGGWRVAIAALGYPAGKTKTMPVDLTGFLDAADPRVRIRTNLAIFWDRIAYTVDDPPAPVRMTALPLSSAELFFRGFSLMRRDDPAGPQVFVHDDVSREPRWADMEGVYTRFGEVRELLGAADDRYVVMKGGDAVRLRFDPSGLPAVPEGWIRDYVVVLDGWDKDADKNTVAGQTVEPLPFHGMDDARYGELAFPDDESHREFVRTYLTRPGGPAPFVNAVRDRSASDVEDRR